LYIDNPNIEGGFLVEKTKNVNNGNKNSLFIKPGVKYLQIDHNTIILEPLEIEFGMFDYNSN
jgi:hypothetical protein